MQFPGFESFLDNACVDRWRVIAIQNYGSSGSKLLHSLLDSHPQVLALPGICGVQYFSAWAWFVASAGESGVDFDRVRAWVMHFFGHLVDPAPTYQFGLTELGEGRDEHAAVDKTRFEEAFDAVLGHVVRASGVPDVSNLDAGNADSYRASFLVSVYVAYAICLGQDIGRKNYLVYPAHSSPMADIGPLCDDFGDVWFVHTVRDPISNIDSIQRRLMEGARGFLPHLDVFSCAVNQTLFDRAPHAPICGVPLYSLSPYPTSSPGRSIGLRLEDLHLNSRPTLEALCAWLGLEYHDCLLHSTFAGKKWWNQPGLRRVNGFSEDIGKGVVRLHPFDRWRIEQAAAPIRAHFGYLAADSRSFIEEHCALALGILLPFALELRCFNFRRYGALVDRIGSFPPFVRRFLACLLLPAFVIQDYAEHRATLLRGFRLHRGRARFVAPLAVPGR